MPAHFLVISDRGEDIGFGEFIAKANQFPFHHSVELNEIRDLLTDHPQTAVFWAADDRERGELLAPMLQKVTTPNRIFAVTQEAVGSYSYLKKYPIFGHHIFRRYNLVAPKLYSRIVGAGVTPFPFGVERYVDAGIGVQKITLVQSTHKGPAVDAIQNVLTGRNVPSRLAAMVAKAVDELVMNAIFDAPMDNKGVRTRVQTAREAEFPLVDREQVDIEFAFADEYSAVSVSDNFGSLNKEVLLKFITQDFSDSVYHLRKDNPGAGLGLHGIIGSGLSMVFICKPKIRTQAIIFFENVSNVRDFRSSFQFLTMLTD